MKLPIEYVVFLDPKNVQFFFSIIQKTKYSELQMEGTFASNLEHANKVRHPLNFHS